MNKSGHYDFPLPPPGSPSRYRNLLMNTQTSSDTSSSVSIIRQDSTDFETGEDDAFVDDDRRMSNDEELTSCCERNAPLVDVFIYSMDKETTNSICRLQTDYHYLCRDINAFIPGATILNNFGMSIEESKLVILVVSPKLLKCSQSLFFIKMAVQYSIDNDRESIITVLDRVNTLQIPKELLQYPICETTGNWFMQLLQIVRKAVSGKGAPGGICNVEHHNDVSSLTLNTPTTTSDPTPIRSISDSQKQRNQAILKRLNPDSKVTQALMKRVQNGTINYQTNMAYFHKLKSTNECVYELTHKYTLRGTTLLEGEIIRIVDRKRPGNQVIVENAKVMKVQVPIKYLSPVIQDLPSIAMDRLQCPITVEENNHFKDKLKDLNSHHCVALDTIITADTKVKINPGDVLQIVERRGKEEYRVINCRNQKGLVPKSFCDIGL